MEDQEQRVEKLDEPEVEAHKLDKFEGRAELGRHELGETDDEPDVEAHRFEKVEPRHDI